MALEVSYRAVSGGVALHLLYRVVLSYIAVLDVAPRKTVDDTKDCDADKQKCQVSLLPSAISVQVALVVALLFICADINENLEQLQPLFAAVLVLLLYWAIYAKHMPLVVLPVSPKAQEDPVPAAATQNQDSDRASEKADVKVNDVDTCGFVSPVEARSGSDKGDLVSVLPSVGSIQAAVIVAATGVAKKNNIESSALLAGFILFTVYRCLMFFSGSVRIESEAKVLNEGESASKEGRDKSKTQDDETKCGSCGKDSEQISTRQAAISLLPSVSSIQIAVLVLSFAHARVMEITSQPLIATALLYTTYRFILFRHANHLKKKNL